MRRFLNRLLGLPLGAQGLMFNYFTAVLAEEIRAAKVGEYLVGCGEGPVLHVHRLTSGMQWIPVHVPP